MKCELAIELEPPDSGQIVIFGLEEQVVEKGVADLDRGRIGRPEPAVDLDLRIEGLVAGGFVRMLLAVILYDPVGTIINFVFQQGVSQ